MDLSGGMPIWQSLLLYVLSLWSVVWKGVALWRAVKQGQRNWFIVMLVLNTIGILELVYLFRFSKKRMTIAELKHWFQQTFSQKSKPQDSK